MKYRSKNRELILERLRMVNNHPTAEEVYLLIKSELPGIGLTTVYRNLEQLSEQGDIVKLDGNVKRYDGDVDKHFHYRCPRCERVFDIDASDLIDSYNEFKYKSSSLGLGLKLEFNKVCDKCKNEKER